MKVIVKKDYEFLSGWVKYNMTWKTEYPGIRNFAIQSVVVVSKEPFSANVLKKWAAEQGIDLDALFTDFDKNKEDVDKVNQFSAIFNEWNHKNIDELNSNKCEVRYTATLDPNYKPYKTAFETIQVYQVDVVIEYKSGAYHIQFPSQGRKKSDSCPYILISGSKMEEMYEEKEAIQKIKARLERYIEDCDTDEKFRALGDKLVAIKKDLKKYM